MASKRKKDIDSDIQFKVIIIGDSGVGKSCFLARYIKGLFIQEHHVTLGAQFQTKTVEIDNYKVKLQIWDTAGQETFRSIVKSFYRNSAAVILVYNLANKASFEHLDDWLKQATENAPANALVMLVGTHSDLPDQRVVSKTQIELFKSMNNISLSFQTSSKDNSNVDIAFEEIANQSFQQYMKKLEVRRNTAMSNLTEKTEKVDKKIKITPKQVEQNKPTEQERKKPCCGG